MIEPNPHLLPIQRVTEHMDERRHYVRLDRNERVEPLEEGIFQEMLQTLTPDSFCAYPDPSILLARLSHSLNLPQNHLYLTNGSDAAIRMLFQTYVRPGDHVLFPEPTYAMYAIYTRIFQAQAHVVDYDSSLSLDIRSILNLLHQYRPRILAIPNPDQPTGATLSEGNLRQLAAAAYEIDTLFIIDEAYYPFYPHSAVPLVRTFNNVVVTRTFSKVGGLAGLRLGFLVAQPMIVDHVQRIRGAHEVNAVAAAIGTYIMDHPEVGDKYLAEVEAGRSVLSKAASKLGLGFPNCPANFQLIQFPDMVDTTSIVTALKQKGYLVKGGFSSPAVRNCIRVTLAGPYVIENFVNALYDVVNQLR